MADATSEPPPPAPSGRDVMKAYEIEAENHRLNNTRNRIDDYRGPAPPRSAPARDYMSVDRVPDHARQVPGRLDLRTLTTGSRAELQLNSGLRGGPARATRHRG
jgi:hypothetical protein